MATFNTTPEFAQASASLAANQGLYNGFLAAGLFWGLATGDRTFKLFFLACVTVAGVFGAVTALPKIFFIQALPAIVAMALVLWLDKPEKRA
jgi:putative membrane protein